METIGKRKPTNPSMSEPKSKNVRYLDIQGKGGLQRVQGKEAGDLDLSVWVLGFIA